MRGPAVHVVDELLKVIDGDAAIRAGADDVGHIGLGDTQFIHAGADAGGKEPAAALAHGHGEPAATFAQRLAAASAGHTLAEFALGAEMGAVLVAALLLSGSCSGGRGGIFVQRGGAGALDFLLRGFDDTHDGPYGQGFAGAGIQ